MTDTAGAGGGPLRSKSARRLTPEIRQSKFPGTPRPSVTLALAAPGPPVQLRWTTLRVQGPTLRDAALANGGNGSPPVAPQLLHPLHLDQRQMSRSPACGGGEWAPPSAAAQSASWSQAMNSWGLAAKPQAGSGRPACRSAADGAANARRSREPPPPLECCLHPRFLRLPRGPGSGSALRTPPRSQRARRGTAPPRSSG